MDYNNLQEVNMNASTPYDQAPTPQYQTPPPTFDSGAAGINFGAVSVEQERAIAEVKGQIHIARMFPRDMDEVEQRLRKSCSRLSFAEQALYDVPNRGVGPTIRFAEEAARCYGNFEYGHRELYRSYRDHKSEVEVFAWDKELNNVSKRQLTIEHKATRKGNKQVVVTTPADVDMVITNIASRQMRGRILALLPKYFIEDGLEICRETIKKGSKNRTLDDRRAKLIHKFMDLGVSTDQLSAYLGHNINQCNVDDVRNLGLVFNAITNGTPASQYFEYEDVSTSDSEMSFENLKEY